MVLILLEYVGINVLFTLLSTDKFAILARLGWTHID